MYNINFLNMLWPTAVINEIKKSALLFKFKYIFRFTIEYNILLSFCQLSLGCISIIVGIGECWHEYYQ